MPHHADSEQARDKLDRIKAAIKSYPDFPKKGILFRYSHPLLLPCCLRR